MFALNKTKPSEPLTRIPKDELEEELERFDQELKNCYRKRGHPHHGADHKGIFIVLLSIKVKSGNRSDGSSELKVVRKLAFIVITTDYWSKYFPGNYKLSLHHILS